jgi:hypothetical protein
MHTAAPYHFFVVSWLLGKCRIEILDKKLCFVWVVFNTIIGQMGMFQAKIRAQSCAPSIIHEAMLI